MDLETDGNLTVKELFELLKMLAVEEERKYLAYNQQSQDSSRLALLYERLSRDDDMTNRRKAK